MHINKGGTVMNLLKGRIYSTMSTDAMRSYWYTVWTDETHVITLTSVKCDSDDEWWVRIKGGERAYGPLRKDLAVLRFAEEIGKYVGNSQQNAVLKCLAEHPSFSHEAKLYTGGER